MQRERENHFSLKYEKISDKFLFHFQLFNNFQVKSFATKKKNTEKVLSKVNTIRSNLCSKEKY